jgi:hypothetical protein
MRISFLLLLAACAPAGNFTGYASYEDAETDSSGHPMEPAPVERDDGGDQPVTFSASFTGTGSFGDLASLCVDADGGLDGTSSSEGTLRANGRFGGDIQATGSESTVTSSLGCVSTDVVIEQLSSLSIRAEIDADTENCTHYCEAHARAACEGEADQDVAADCEASADADCYDECTTERHSIVAEVAITDGATLDGLVLSDGSFGDFQADLTFSSME